MATCAHIFIHSPPLPPKIYPPIVSRHARPAKTLPANHHPLYAARHDFPVNIHPLPANFQRILYSIDGIDANYVGHASLFPAASLQAPPSLTATRQSLTATPYLLVATCHS